MRLILMSEDWFSALSSDQQAQVMAAVKAGTAANRAWIKDWRPKVRQRHEEAGVTVSELDPGERDKMAEAAKSIWTEVLTEDELKIYLDAIASMQ
jgi:TRAP-type C4-dicarboxylate transport system substrate-binding protein